jgi:two-component system KDP operon response regulator KdpE
MTAALPKVLVIEDEAPIRKLLRTGLSRQGFEVVEASDGQRALAQLFNNPDVVTLDLGLPDVDGLELLRQIRERRDDLPIVVLSSHSDEAIKVQALDLGADDYITKPFGMNELIARIRAALRHRLQVQGQRPVLRVGELEVDLVRRTVTVSGRSVKLSPKEYELLRLLAHHAGKVLTHEFLLAALWATPVDANYLRIYVRQLRAKIEPDPKHPQYIVTQSSIGYRLRSD